MNDSILLSVKTTCNVAEDNTDFDNDLILITNSVLSVLHQLGIGPETSFSITGPDETWTDLLGEDTDYLNMVKSYVGLKVRLIFDPPVSGAVKESLSKIVEEFEWRSNVAVENHQLEEVRQLERNGSS